MDLDEIERRGIHAAYLHRLIEFVNDDTPEDDAYLLGYYTQEDKYVANTRGLWALIRATPEQRARAFLEAVERDV